MGGRRRVILALLDVANVVAIAIPSGLLPWLVTDSWIVWLGLFVLLCAVLGLPLRRAFRPLYLKAGAEPNELR